MSSATSKVKANTGKKRNFLKLIPATQKRAAIYCRVSTSKQKEEGTSLEKQLRGCLGKAHSEFGRPMPSEDIVKNYIQRLQSGENICEDGIYIEDYSGYYLAERGILTKLRADVRSGFYDVVVCYETDRLSRKPAHRYILKEEWCELGVSLVYVTQNFEDNPTGEFMESAYSFVAEVEREKIRERTIDGKKRRLSNNKIHRFGPNKYGWRRDEEKEVRVVVPEQATVIELMYRLISEGNSLAATARILNERSHKAPGDILGMPNRRVPGWTSSAVQRIITEPAYKGEARMWKTRDTKVGGKRQITKRDESETILLSKEVCPPIVTDELWEAANTQLSSPERQKTRAMFTRNSKVQAMLRGLMTCGTCEQPMYFSGNVSRGVPRYRCASGIGTSGWKPCQSKVKSVGAPYIEEAVWNYTLSVLRDSNAIVSAVERALEKGVDESLAIDLKNCSRQLDNMTRKQQRLVAQLSETDDEDVIGLIKAELKSIEHVKKQLKSERETLESKIKAQDTKVSGLRFMKRWCANISKTMETMDESRRHITLTALGVIVRVFEGYATVKMKFDPEKSEFAEDYKTEKVVEFSKCKGAGNKSVVGSASS